MSPQELPSSQEEFDPESLYSDYFYFSRRVGESTLSELLQFWHDREYYDFAAAGIYAIGTMSLAGIYDILSLPGRVTHLGFTALNNLVQKNKYRK